MQLKHIKLLRLCYAIILGSIILFTTGCDNDENNEPDNEQELITTVTLNFFNATTNVTFTAKDLDGDGGNAPVIQPIVLKANTDYNLSITFSDESKSPVENITGEVQEESNEHLVCVAGSGAMPSPTAQDKDDNGKNLGLTNSFKTGAAGSGTLKITLKHEPDKDASNACSTGETDVEQTFNVTISN